MASNSSPGLVGGISSHNGVAGALQESQDSVELEDENEDGDKDNHDYHHIIGRIANVLESMDLESM